MSPANPCDDIIARCRWKGSLYRCDSLFQLVNTSEGACCSFNNHAYPKWNYNPKVLSSIPKEPRRVTSCGFQTGLTLLLRPTTEDYLGTQIASGGFKVVWEFSKHYFISSHFSFVKQILIHDAYNFPDQNAVTKLLPEKTEAFLSIGPGKYWFEITQFYIDFFVVFNEMM